MPPRVPLLAVCAAAVLFAPGCGDDGNSAADPSKFIDNEKIERAIEKSVKEQRNLRVFASCPANIPIQKGRYFICTVVTPDEKRSFRFRVTQKDDKGNVGYRAEDN